MFLNTFLLYLFLFLLPTQLGKHFFLPFSYLSGIRVDYLAPTVYLIDIVFLFLFLLNLKKIFLSLNIKTVIYFFVFICLNFLVSSNKIISAYHYLRLLELFCVYLIIKKNTLSAKGILSVFLTSAFLQLGLSLIQLVTKHSVQGIFYFLGERYFNLSTPGIAQVSLFGKIALRPYGTFSHPNSLAGFYLLSYFFVLTTKKFDKSGWFKNVFLLISSLLVLISFSKAAVMTYLILNTVYGIMRIRREKNACIFCLFAKLIVFLALAFIFLTAQTDPLTLQKRVFLLGNSFSVLKNHLFLGVGFGNYLIVQNKLSQRYLDIVNQPVHNIFLLFLSEWGLIGIGFLTFLFNWLGKNTKKFLYVFLAVLFTGFFDHYWLTLVQNLFLLSVVIGLL